MRRWKHGHYDTMESILHPGKTWFRSSYSVVSFLNRSQSSMNRGTWPRAASAVAGSKKQNGLPVGNEDKITCPVR
jgi:hypothetical protein